MTYLLDTDHFSILQRRSGPEFQNLATRMGAHTPADFALSIVTFHEQVIGAHAWIQGAKNPRQVVEGYAFLDRAFLDYGRFTVLRFDEEALSVFSGFGGGLRVNVRDLRIAAIAIANGLILLTRNRVHFERVPGLRFEDWAVGGEG